MSRHQGGALQSAYRFVWRPLVVHLFQLFSFEDPRFLNLAGHSFFFFFLAGHSDGLSVFEGVRDGRWGEGEGQLPRPRLIFAP